MKPVVALDMDELLFPLLDNLLDFVNRRDGASWTPDHFHVYSPHTVWQVPLEQSVATINEFFALLDDHPEPVEGAVEAIEQLKSQFELYVVTARESALEDVTVAWLTHRFAEAFTGVHLCNLFSADQSQARSKAEVCKELGAVALVDDSPEHTAAVAQEGRRAILFGDYRWNRELDPLPRGVTRARTWPEVVDQLQELAS